MGEIPLRGGGSAVRDTPRRHGPIIHRAQGPSRKPGRDAWARRASCPCGSAWARRQTIALAAPPAALRHGHP
eukprot:141888-Pyramimonas_sp.AAC.1